MQLQITGRHVEVTDAIREFVENKFKKLERHFDHITGAHVILSVNNHEQEAEATLNIAGNDVFAKSTEENMYAAIDTLIDKLDRQLIKHKEKIKNHHVGEKPSFDDEQNTGTDN